MRMRRPWERKLNGSIHPRKGWTYQRIYDPSVLESPYGNVIGVVDGWTYIEGCSPQIGDRIKIIGMDETTKETTL